MKALRVRRTPKKTQLGAEIRRGKGKERTVKPQEENRREENSFPFVSQVLFIIPTGPGHPGGRSRSSARVAMPTGFVCDRADQVPHLYYCIRRPPSPRVVTQNTMTEGPSIQNVPTFS